jgi:hypothetical protein
MIENFRIRVFRAVAHHLSFSRASFIGQFPLSLFFVGVPDGI